MADEKIMPENGLEVRYERYKGIIKNFTLMSDIFMRNVFKQRECLDFQCALCLFYLAVICQRNGKAAVAVRACALSADRRLQLPHCVCVILQFDVAVALDKVHLFY